MLLRLHGPSSELRKVTLQFVLFLKCHLQITKCELDLEVVILHQLKP